MKICKYELKIKGWQTVEISSKYRILGVDMCNNGNAQLVVAIDEKSPLTRVAFEMKQVNEYIYENNHKYIGCIKTLKGDTFYVFEFK